MKTHHSLSSKPDRKVVSAILDLLSDLTAAEAHLRVWSRLSSLLRERWALHYYDFIEFTAYAHWSGFVTATSRVLDRHKKAASLYWLLVHIESHPGELVQPVNVPRLRNALLRLAPTERAILTLRHKFFAHTQRIERSTGRNLREELTVTAATKGGQLLEALRRVVTQVRKSFDDDEVQSSIFAVDEETEEAIEALKAAAQRRAP